MDRQLNERQDIDLADEALMASFLNGDQGAFYLLVQRYRTRITNFCFWMLGSPADAEDAAQEVFLKLFTGRHRYQRGEPLRPWLYRIASNHCLNQRRRQRIIHWISLEALLELGWSTKPTSTEPRPDTRLQSKEDAAWLEAQIVRLPAGLRVPLLLKRFEGLRNKDIARVLNISVSAVESRIHRALKQLRAAAERVRTGGKKDD